MSYSVTVDVHVLDICTTRARQVIVAMFKDQAEYHGFTSCQVSRWRKSGHTAKYVSGAWKCLTVTAVVDGNHAKDQPDAYTSVFDAVDEAVKVVGYSAYHMKF